MIAELEGLDEESILALTLIGEARGEPIEGIVGVGSVIRNRVQLKYNGAVNYIDVCLTRYQFSCWLPGKDYDFLINTAKNIRDHTPINDIFLNQCFLVASGIIKWNLRDNTKGATHYLVTSLFNSPTCPHWAKVGKVTATLGSQTFIIVN